MKYYPNGDICIITNEWMNELNAYEWIASQEKKSRLFWKPS